MLGDVLDGHGVTIAPAQKQDREQWDEVTVALVIPAPDEDEDPVSLGEAIAKAVSGVRKSGQSFETLQTWKLPKPGPPPGAAAEGAVMPKRNPAPAKHAATPKP